MNIRSGIAGSLPDVVVGGAQKSGTSSLHRIIAESPGFAGATTKEVHYLDRFYFGNFFYASMFPSANSLRFVESTPNYLFHPTAAERALQTIPQARFVFVLRNPAERAISHYNHQRRKGREHHGFLDALRLEESRLGDLYGASEVWASSRRISYRATHFSYLSRGCYGRQLQKWFDKFDASQILVLNYEKLFVERTSSEAARLSEFLGLGGGLNPELFPTANPGDYDRDQFSMPREFVRFLQEDTETLNSLSPDLSTDWAY
ncbi:MAG TPA: hypothetical protein DCG06_01635 [Deltaproteobacteria bacterium]|nr:hypothetical protein [Deltaproteobacteria bacterium]